MRNLPYWCEAPDEETGLPCPACGATIEGNDPVRGICQAVSGRPKPEPILYFALQDKETGEIVASEPVL